MRWPTFKHERELREQGYSAIVGVDEAGCGAIAGPVVAGAVILPLNSRIGRLHDSKLLSARGRERIFDLLTERAEAWAAGVVDVAEIMEMGIRPAVFLAMRRAVDALPRKDYCLVDAWTIPELSLPQRAVMKGDRLVKSIAAGSIVAKVTRDRLMQEWHKKHPGYGFDEHKGYGTRRHRDMITEYGPCEIHRLNYKMFKQ